MNTSSLNNYKSYYAHGGMVSSRELYNIFSMLRNITGEGTVTVKSDFGRGIRIVGTPASTESIKTLTCNLTAESEVTVTAGYFNMHSAGISKAVTVSSPVSIASGTQFIYVSYLRDHSGNPYLAVSATYPLSTTTSINWCLATYVDKVKTAINHDGDINIDLPII